MPSFSIAVAATTCISSLIGAIFYFIPWLKYDFDYIKRLVRVMFYIHYYTKTKTTIVDCFEKAARLHPARPFLKFNDEVYTYGEMQKQINKVANMAVAMGLKKNDIVAIIMYNEPAYLWTWMGLVTAGIQVAFLNYNLRAKSLLHCFSVSDAKMLIIGQDADLVAAVDEVSGELAASGVKLVSWASADQLPSSIKSLVPQFKEAPETKFNRDAIRKSIDIRLHTICYIYTSGTTGLPKAAVLSHLKFLKGCLLPTALTDIYSDDVIYTSLPLYHSAAGCIATGSAIFNRCTLVLRRKFSATSFWDDCRKYDVTVIQYIGELCRYLLARPQNNKDDRNHKVRIAIGNGLRRDIWPQFQNRFGINMIGELYAATEGNGGLINVHNKVGVVGRASPFLNIFFPIYLIKYDIQAEQPVRGPDGFCVVCQSGEPGLMVTKIFRGFEFEGYKGNTELTQKKVLQNVFKKGDMYFNTGDLLVRDDDYFFYFNDRIGDTFRWKGENVSTLEVANVIGNVAWIEDCNVYGVAITGHEGRAGMAAITLKGGFSPLSEEQRKEFYTHVSDHLPLYAIPRFVRILKGMIVTETLKQRKIELLADGFDLEKIKEDVIYVLNLDKKTYVPLTEELYRNVTEGLVKF